MSLFIKKSITSINIRILLTGLFVLVTGIAAGIFFGGLLPDDDISHLIPFIQNQYSTPTAGTLPAILTNLIYLLFIGFAGFTLYGFPLALLLLMIRGFATGFCDCLLLYSIDTAGLFKFIISFLLPQLLLCAVYLIATAFSVSYALSVINGRNTAAPNRAPAFSNKQYSSDGFSDFFIFFVILAITVFLLSLFT